MAATDQQIVNEARDSLLRILQSDSSNWSEEDRSQRHLEIDRLQNLIDRYEKRVAASSGRRIFQPVVRVNG